MIGQRPPGAGSVYKVFYLIRIAGAVMMLGVAGLIILTLFGVDTGLLKAR